LAQIKVYGLREQLDPIKARLSEVIHGCAVDALQLPRDKRFHRFFPLDRADFYFPADRSDRYTIIEVSMFAGRSIVAKKRFIQSLFQRLSSQLALPPQDVEITIFETPKASWGIRGKPGDELELSYPVEV
jgi:phenylpyruvate tautomerase PptA (4-oxalocrotonate tautomerase family)